jgi:hypothetical protein
LKINYLNIVKKTGLLVSLALQFIFSQIRLDHEEIIGSKYRLTFSNSGYAYTIDAQNRRVLFHDIQGDGTQNSFALPQKEIFIALPSKQNPKFNISIKNQNTINDVLPTKSKIARKINDSLVVYEENTTPDNLIPIEKSQYRFNGFLWVENRYCMHFTIFPYSVNVHTRQMYELKDFSIQIDLSSPTILAKTTAAPNPSTIIDNIHYGTPWQQSSTKFTIASTDTWIDYSQEYVKFGIAKDALYRVTYDDLQRYGVPVASLNPKNLKLYLQGEEIPIYVFGEQDNSFDRGDYIEFVGRRNYGDARYRQVPPFGKSYYEYLNLYSDTTIYWLNWSGIPGKRVDTTNVVAGTPSDTLKYYDELFHIENNYYWDFSLNPSMEGAARREEPDLYENKTWNEGTIAVGKKTVNFDVTKLYSNKPAHAYVKLQDYSTNNSVPTPTDHLVSLSINSQPSVYDSGYVVKYQQKVLHAAFNSNDLLNGINNVNITSYPTPNTQNLLLSDWYELEYPRQLIATNDSLVFTYRSIPSPKRSMIIISGFNAASFSLYRFNGNDSSVSKITNYIRSNDTIRFIDSVKVGISYFLFADNKISAPIFLYKKKFANLRSTARKADYIAITHTYFQQAAINYLSFISQTYNVSTSLIDINDIYDEFNYGFFAPEPIRDFLKSAYSNWQEPKPKYVVLIGKATYDFYGYKSKYFGASAINNYVPSYGNPVSDYWFTIWDTTGANIPMMCIGRIPAKNTDEFQYYFNKHQKYVSNGFDDWNKRYIFFSGGSSNSIDEITNCRTTNETVLNGYVKPSPIGGNGVSFFKTVSPITNFGPDPPYTTEFINNTISQGSIFISYIGHSGTQTWDNSIADVTQLSNNRDRNPMITDFGCSTAKHAEPDVFSFSEIFIVDPKGQAIDYIGNSSLGFTSTAYTFPFTFYKKILIDTSVSIGESHRLAKIEYLKQYGTTGPYRVFSFTNSIVGDPIIKLPIPAKPNFSFSNSIVQIDPDRPTESDDSVTVTINYFNLGKAPIDSLSIMMNDEYNGIVLVQKNTKVAVPLFEDTIRFRIPVKGRPGEHTIYAKLDPADRYDEIYKNDNTITYKIQVASSSIRHLAISASSNQTNGTILFLNPGSKPQNSSFAVLLSVNENFAQHHTFTIPFDTFYTKYFIPNNFRNSRIWLKTVFDTTSAEGLAYSYYVGTKDNYLVSDDYSMEHLKYTGTEHLQNNIVLDTTMLTFTGISAGAYAGATAIVTKNGQNLTPSSNLTGHHVAVFDTITYSLVYFNRFNVSAGGANITDYENLLDTLSGKYLVIISVCNDGFSNLTTKLRNEIKLLGSKYIDSLTAPYSWTMIGRKGAPAGAIKEQFSRAYGNMGRVQVDTTISLPNLSGTFETEEVGPVAEWNSIEIKELTSSGNSVRFTVVGMTDAAVADTLNSFTMTDSIMNISSLNAVRYPKLKLLGELTRSVASNSPSVQSIGINYKSLPELGTNYQVVKAIVTENGNVIKEVGVNDTILQGENLRIQFSVYNVGGVTANKIGVRVNSLWENNNNELISSIVIDSLAPQSYRQLSVPYNTSLGYGRRFIRITIDPDTLIRELFKDNNYYSYPISIMKDTSKPSYDITFNGIHIYDGDYTMPHPTIQVKIYDTSPLPISSSSNVIMKLDNRPVSLGANADSLFEIRSGPEKAVVVYRPVLEKGNHLLSFQVKDATGIYADTSAKEIQFRVDTDMEILNVFNYPNPFSTETYFTCILTNYADEVEIKIYTISGRLIRDIPMPPQSENAYYQVYWNGRDQDGDEVANGIYFYKIIAKSNGSAKEVIQKLARVR